MIQLTQVNDTRIKVKDNDRRIIVLAASYNKTRGYYRLTPLGDADGWAMFWDVWELNKIALKHQGFRVTKEKGVWRIYFSPKDPDIQLATQI